MSNAENEIDGAIKGLGDAIKSDSPESGAQNALALVAVFMRAQQRQVEALERIAAALEDRA